MKEYGAESVLGLDGNYVAPDMLLIDREEFIAADLTSPVFPNIQKRFELALSLEVAEHLPQSRAESFVQDLTDLSDIVLFSAAIPHQGGEGHINCQWQTYWAEKFMARGYQPKVSFREKIWDEPSIDFWYRQNSMLFIKTEKEPVMPPYVNVVHPDMYIQKVTGSFGYAFNVWRRKIKYAIRDVFK